MEQAQRSWLSLVTFCAVTGLLVALGSAVILAGASLAFAVAQPAAGADANTIPMASAVQIMEQPAAAQTAVDAHAQVTAQPIDDSGAGSSQTFAGMITDSRCGARHRMNSGKTSAECARSCVRHGAHYVLVDGEKSLCSGGLSRPTGEAGGRESEHRGNARGQHDQGQGRRNRIAPTWNRRTIPPAAPPSAAVTFLHRHFAPRARPEEQPAPH